MGYKRAGYKKGGLVCGKVDREKGRVGNAGKQKLFFQSKVFVFTTNS